MLHKKARGRIGVPALLYCSGSAEDDMPDGEKMVHLAPKISAKAMGWHGPNRRWRQPLTDAMRMPRATMQSIHLWITSLIVRGERVREITAMCRRGPGRRRQQRLTDAKHMPRATMQSIRLWCCPCRCCVPLSKDCRSGTAPRKWPSINRAAPSQATVCVAGGRCLGVDTMRARGNSAAKTVQRRAGEIVSPAVNQLA